MSASMSASASTPPHRVTVAPGVGGVVTPATGSIGLSGAFFAAAVFYLTAGAIGVVWIAPEIAAATFLSPRVAGVTHLFTLGWITATIFGALYQLLPVALGAPIRWQRIARASWWTFVPGVGAFASGVVIDSSILRYLGVGLLTTGIALVVINVVASLARSAHRDATWAAIAIAFTFLVATLGLGLILVHNLHTGFIAAARVRVLATHLHVAIVGWALMMIVGVSHRLLPMFLLAHTPNVRWTRRSLGFLSAGVVALGCGLTSQSAPLRWVGTVCLDVGLACFVAQALVFYRARVRKRVDAGLRFAATALGFLAAAAVLGTYIALRGSAAPSIGVAYVIAGLLGGVCIYVLGFTYKIIPLLVWTAAYRGRMGRSAVPLVADMYSPRLASIQLVAMAAGVAVLAASALFASSTGVYVGALSFLIGTALFLAQLVRIALHLRVSHAE
ncbi:MAG: hypothetical protein JJD97_00255 [Gemmatimonadaceae bacterium]|nr:hypothetical protein [Gemmatimonadaceae bacterium]